MRDWFDLGRGWVFLVPFVGGLTAAIAAALIVGELNWAYILPTAGGIIVGWFVVVLIAHASRARR